MDYEDTFAFLKARDPSIVAGHLNNQKKIVRKRLILHSILNKTSEETIVEHIENEKKTHFQVFLRLKPTNDGSLNKLYKIDNEQLICFVPEGSQCLRNMREGDSVIKRFTFDKIFDTLSSQVDLFDLCVKPQILDFINGENSTIMSYGASGSGKTYTMLGTVSQPGIIPRTLEYLFKSLPHLSEYPHMKPLPASGVVQLDEVSRCAEVDYRNKLFNNSKLGLERAHHERTYKLMQERLSSDSSAHIPNNGNVYFSVWVSFLEIYNEHVFDLFVPEPERGKNRKKLRIGEDSDGNAYVKDLTCLNVTSGQQAYELLQYGKHNLKYAATSVNDHSSRSHCIFTIKLVQSNKTGSRIQLTHFNFCDLAGSERVKKTCNVGDRLKETNNINTSLHVLGRCLKSVRDLQSSTNMHNKLIPYRDSKLTRLFKRSLSGSEYISMIVNINPQRDVFDESQHVLNFSAIAKDIIIEPVNKEIKLVRNTRFSHYLQNRDSKHSKMETITDSNMEQSKEATIESLTLELEAMREYCLQQAYEKNNFECEIRSEVCAKYNDIIKRCEEFWKKRVADTEENLKAQYEEQIADLKNSLDKENNSKKRRLDVDSDDDIIEDFEANYKYLNNEYMSLKDTVKELQCMVNELKQKNDELTIENNKLKMNLECDTKNNLVDQLKDREEILEGAAIECSDLQKQLNDCQKDLDSTKVDNMKLTDENFELQTQLEYQLESKSVLQDKYEEIEMECEQLRRQLKEVSDISSCVNKDL